MLRNPFLSWSKSSYAKRASAASSSVAKFLQSGLPRAKSEGDELGASAPVLPGPLIRFVPHAHSKLAKVERAGAVLVDLAEEAVGEPRLRELEERAELLDGQLTRPTAIRSTTSLW